MPPPSTRPRRPPPARGQTDEPLAMSLWGEALRSPARSDVVSDELRASTVGSEGEIGGGTVVLPESLDLQELRQRSSPRHQQAPAAGQNEDTASGASAQRASPAVPVTPQKTARHAEFTGSRPPGDAERAEHTPTRQSAVSSCNYMPAPHMQRVVAAGAMGAIPCAVGDQHCVPGSSSPNCESSNHTAGRESSEDERGAPVPESQDLQELRQRRMWVQESLRSDRASPYLRMQQREEAETQRKAAIQALASAGWRVGATPGSSAASDDADFGGAVQTQPFPPQDQMGFGKILSTALHWAAIALVSAIVVGAAATISISIGMASNNMLGDLAGLVPPSPVLSSPAHQDSQTRLSTQQLAEYEEALPLACQRGATAFRESQTLPRIAEDETVVACYCNHQLQSTVEQLLAPEDNPTGHAGAATATPQPGEVHSVVLPEGLLPGQTLSFRATDGRGPFSVLVPEGAVAGQRLQVTVPKDIPSPSPQHALGSGTAIDHQICQILTNYGRQGTIHQPEQTQPDTQTTAHSTVIKMVGKPVHPALTAEYVELAQLVGKAVTVDSAAQKGDASKADSATVSGAMAYDTTQQVSWWEQLVDLYRKFHPLDVDSLRFELVKMRLSAVKRRAVALGVTIEALERADDMDDIKAEVIQLVLRHSV